MKFLLKVSFSVEGASKLFQDGTFAETLQSIVDEIKPESAYFTEIQGERTGLFIVNVDRVSQIPKIVAPFLLAFDAKLEFHPVMTMDDLSGRENEPSLSFGYAS